MDQLEDYGAFPRADARPALSHARRVRPAATTSRTVDVINRVVLDQQDAGEPDPRLRRAAALSRAGAAGAADFGRARARPSRRASSAISCRRRNSAPRRGRARSTICGDYLRAVETATGDGRLADLEATPRRGARAGRTIRHRLCGRGRARRCRTWAISRRCCTPGARDKAGPKNGAMLDGDGQHRSARRGRR